MTDTPVSDFQTDDCASVLPVEPFRNIALTFSGGGFRAAAFSLGALSYLYRRRYEKFNAPLLDSVKFITSTSGGSITNGKFACAIYSDPSFDFPGFYNEMRTAMDGELLLKKVLDVIRDDSEWQESATLKAKDGGIQAINKSRNFINAFAKAYHQLVFNKGTLDCIYSPVHKPSLEKICFNATEFNNGLNFYFQVNGHTGTIDKRGNGYLKVKDPEVFRHLRMGDIVAASSCFPSGFEPIIYPNDFITEKLTDINAMYHAVSYTHNDPTKLHLVNEKPFALMDGGIADNMGIHAVMVEDSERLASGKGSFDLILACDVTSYFTDPLQQEVPKTSGWTTKVSVNTFLLPFKLAPVIFLLCILSIAYRVWPVAGYILLLPSFIPSVLFLLAWWKIRGMKRSAGSSIAKTILSKLGYFLKLPLSSIINLVQARVSSSILLVTDLFLKQIRRCQYENLFTKPRLVHRTISCLIYEFSTSNRERRRSNLESRDRAWWTSPMKDILMPSQKMEVLTNEARSMGTTLWFDESDVKDEKRDKIIATGQFTMCYNLIKHICRLEVSDQKHKQDAALQQLKADLLKDWAAFQQQPMFMVNDLKV